MDRRFLKLPIEEWVLLYPALIFGFFRTLYLKHFTLKEVISEWIVAVIVSAFVFYVYLNWFSNPHLAIPPILYSCIMAVVALLPIITFIFVLLYLFIFEKTTSDLAIITQKTTMLGVFSKIGLKFSNAGSNLSKGISVQRCFRFENDWYLFLLWLFTGPLNPNALIFYYGYETSVLVNRDRIGDIFGHISIPTAFMAAVAIYYLRRKKSFSLRDIIGFMLLALFITLLISPFFLQFAEIFSTSKYAPSSGGPLGVFGTIGLFIFTFIFGWLFGMIPIIGINLAKYAVIFAIIFLWAGSKRAAKHAHTDRSHPSKA
jgi:hypothetical protein